MPWRCSVSGCRSNYDTEKEKVSTLTLPKDPYLRSQWIQNIPTDFTHLKHPIVCIKHFRESEIITVDKVIVKGELKVFPRKIPKLVENAVPTIFLNLPSLPTSIPSTPKRRANVKKRNFELAIKENLEEQRKHQDENKTEELQGIDNCLCKKFVKTRFTYHKMPHTCTVPGCQDNYEISPKVSTDGSPSDERMRQKCNLAINRKDCWKPLKNSSMEQNTECQPLKENIVENNVSENDFHEQRTIKTENTEEDNNESSIIEKCDNENSRCQEDNKNNKKLLDAKRRIHNLTLPFSTNDERENIFGKYIASEIRILSKNHVLYSQTKQAILKVLKDTSFKRINSASS